MKDLVFSITLNNRTFNIVTNYMTTKYSYEFKDKYNVFLGFVSNIYAHVEYKNAVFSGTITKRNNWGVRLDWHTVVRKRNDMYYFESTKSTQIEEKIEMTSDALIEYPENILSLYNQLVNDLFELYLSIENKEKFKQEICEYLCENYDDVESPDEIVEYENYIDVGDDEAPIIERYTIRTLLADECEEFFLSFRKAEIDNKNKESIITLENVIKEVHELREVPYEFLHREFDKYLNENKDDLIKLDIYYHQFQMLHSIGVNLYWSYQYYVFINTMEEKIDKILSGMEDYDCLLKKDVYNHFKMIYNKRNIPSDEEFKKSVMNYADDYIAFFHLYNKFVSLFNSNHIMLEWSDEIIKTFQKYDKEECSVDPQLYADYEAYKYIVPHYKKVFFKKNSNKYKPVIQQLPDFISYGTAVIDILFKYNILIDDEDSVFYNEEGDIDSAYEDMKKLLKT